MQELVNPCLSQMTITEMFILFIVPCPGISYPLVATPLMCSGSEFMVENINFCDRHKMDTDYNNMMIVELKALATAHGLRGYTELRKAGLITFLQDNATPERPVNPVTCVMMH